MILSIFQDFPRQKKFPGVSKAVVTMPKDKNKKIPYKWQIGNITKNHKANHSVLYLGAKASPSLTYRMARITPYTEKNRIYSKKVINIYISKKTKYKSLERYNQTVKITKIWCPYLILLLPKSYDFAQKCVFTKIWMLVLQLPNFAIRVSLVRFKQSASQFQIHSFLY